MKPAKRICGSVLRVNDHLPTARFTSRAAMARKRLQWNYNRFRRSGALSLERVRHMLIESYHRKCPAKGNSIKPFQRFNDAGTLWQSACSAELIWVNVHNPPAERHFPEEPERNAASMGQRRTCGYKN